MEFSGRTCLVTGAAGNLGRALAAAFAGQGAKLILLDHSEEHLRSAYGKEDEARVLIQANLLEAKEIEEALSKSRFPRIDVVCNIAGGFRMGTPVHETPAEVWESMLDLNARSVIHTARVVVPRMISARYGKIVNVAALAGLAGKGDMGAYSAAKSAVIRLTESMSAELRDHGINVNCIMPSIIDTPQNRAAMPKADPGRWVTPQALADVVMFLASERSSAIHGAAIPVTGRV